MKNIYIAVQCTYLSKFRQWEFLYIKFYAIRPNINWDKSKVHGNDDDINNDIKVSINENAFFMHKLYTFPVNTSFQLVELCDISLAWHQTWHMARFLEHCTCIMRMEIDTATALLSILYHTANLTVRILDIDRTRNAFGRRTNK